MVLILSQSIFEISTEDVIDWLLFYDTEYKRINGDEYVDIHQHLDNISVVWYRRWSHGRGEDQETQVDSFKNALHLYKNIQKENSTKSAYLFYRLRDVHWLSHPGKTSVNKLIVLDKAKEFGFNVPNWAVIDQKKKLIDFKEKYTRIITKSVDNASPMHNAECSIMFYTQEVTQQHIDILPETFSGSFFQQYVDKQYEIRAFFINDKVYAMAIFTNDKVDYRKGIEQLRKVPYQLPIEIEDKIKVLMKDLQLNTGSVDLIYGKDGKVYFLEINPVGQFGMVSAPCNYYLEREVANNLTQKNE